MPNQTSDQMLASQLSQLQTERTGLEQQLATMQPQVDTARAAATQQMAEPTWGDTIAQALAVGIPTVAAGLAGGFKNAGTTAAGAAAGWEAGEKQKKEDWKTNQAVRALEFQTLNEQLKELRGEKASLSKDLLTVNLAEIGNVVKREEAVTKFNSDRALKLLDIRAEAIDPTVAQATENLYKTFTGQDVKVRTKQDATNINTTLNIMSKDSFVPLKINELKQQEAIARMAGDNATADRLAQQANIIDEHRKKPTQTLTQAGETLTSGYSQARDVVATYAETGVNKMPPMLSIKQDKAGRSFSETKIPEYTFMTQLTKEQATAAKEMPVALRRQREELVNVYDAIKDGWSLFQDKEGGDKSSYIEMASMPLREDWAKKWGGSALSDKEVAALNKLRKAADALAILELKIHPLTKQGQKITEPDKQTAVQTGMPNDLMPLLYPAPPGTPEAEAQKGARQKLASMTAEQLADVMDLQMEYYVKSYKTAMEEMGAREGDTQSTLRDFNKRMGDILNENSNLYQKGAAFNFYSGGGE